MVVIKTSKTLATISGLVNDFKLTYIDILIKTPGNSITGQKYSVYSSIPPFPPGRRPIGAKLLTYSLMTSSGPELSRQVAIVNELGLHARSAAQIAALANRSTASVWIQKGNEKADASSIVDILTLACEKGSKITISIENKADFNILEAITELVEGGFGE
jgi:phosphotransferase system HPr (HPr) family protein